MRMVVAALALLSVLGFTLIAMAARPATARRARWALSVSCVVTLVYVWGLAW